jgi:tetratricopeptide (TPR) repeat protein
MMDIHRNSTEQWTSMRANSLAALCLAVGLAGGWLIRGLKISNDADSVAAASAMVPAKADAGTTTQIPSPTRLKEMAKAQAEPMLDKLKANPDDPDLLTRIGNLYYDAQQYSIAVDYYGRALKAKPVDAAVRTDMATAYWYMGDADTAIAQFNKSLAYEPNKPNTLFNLGLVKMRGKKDKAGAISDWQKLLAANPNYGEKDKVLRMIADANSGK